MARPVIGFHAGVGGNRTGIGDYFAALDAAGIPFVVKSVNDGGLAAEAAASTSSSTATATPAANRTTYRIRR